MPNQTKIYNCVFSSPELKTVEDYCADYSSPAFKFVGRETEFLEVANEDGVTNRERVIAMYMPWEVLKYSSYPDSELPLKIGIMFAIPADQVERNGLLTQGLQPVSNNDVAFKAKALAALEADKGYVSITRPVQGKLTLGSVKEMVPEVTVWIWCRSLNHIFDLSPFVSSVNTNMNRTNGGNFQITLPPLVASFENGSWTIQKNSLKFYVNPKNLSLSEQGYVAEGSLYDENLRRNNFLFHHIIQPNDLVFIRFETLQLEKDKRFEDASKMFVDKSQIPGKIYDMIGLVDVDNQSIVAANNDVTINIVGRDLSKILIEDGSYYYALEHTKGIPTSGFINGTHNGLAERVYGKTALSIFALWYNQSIEHVFSFVLNQLSNIKIVPDDLFEAYDKFSPNKRTKKFISGDVFKTKHRDQLLQDYKESAINTIKQLRLVNKVSNRDSSKESEIVIQLYEDLKLFLTDIRTKKVRTVDGNTTTGWKAFNWITPNGTVEKLQEDGFPIYFDGALYQKNNLQANGELPNSNLFTSIFSSIDSYIDVERSQGNYKEQFKEDFVPGIWQIIKLVVDKSVTDRRINDSSLSSASGSIINFLNRMCQQPFVELILDTYHDNYLLTVRKPPTDQIGLISLIEGKVETEDGRITNGAPAIIDVYDEDVISENLFFDDRDVYSWYHLKPEANYINDEVYTWAYLQPIFFQEYADIWGSRPMDLTHKYTPYQPLDTKKESDLDLNEKQAIYDLKFMIDSNMANPFLRKGTLVLNGDRRLKVGNILRYHPTGEIFTIDNVGQNHRIGESLIDRTTTVQVSRGMVEQLIYGIPTGNGNHISYFNIINTKLSLNYTDTPETVTKVVKDGYQIIKQESLPALSKKYPSDAIKKPGNIGLDLLNKYNTEQKARFIQLINAINDVPGQFTVEITTTVRKTEENVILFGEKGKSKVASVSGKKFAHDIGNSIDFNLIQKVGGKKYSYTQKLTLNENRSKWVATGIPHLAKELGFLWGGDSFAGHYDPVHFQLVPIQSGTKKIPKTKTVTETVKKRRLDQSAIFSNFKVDKDVFNFFLRGEQFDKKYRTGTVNRKIYNSDVAKLLGR